MAKWKIILIVSGIVAAMIFLSALSYLIGSANGVSDFIDSSVAMRWIDGRYGSAFYGVHVFGKTAEDGKVAVSARIYISAAGYFHDCGQIGEAPDWPAARAIFSNIRATEAALYIGDYQVERAKFESHR